jgi:hypothetical protein
MGWAPLELGQGHAHFKTLDEINQNKNPKAALIFVHKLLEGPPGQFSPRNTHLF